MKAYFSIGLIAAAAVLPLVALATYNDVSLDSNVIINVGSASLGVSGSSNVVESMAVTADAVDFTLAAGSSIRVTSGDRYNMNFTQGTAVNGGFTCDSAQSYVDLSLLASYPGSAVSITVTPTATTCNHGSSGGGNTGGGAPPPVITPATTTLTIVPAVTKVVPKKCLAYATKVVKGKKLKVCTKYTKTPVVKKLVVKKVVVKKPIVKKPVVKKLVAKKKIVPKKKVSPSSGLGQ